MKQLMRVARQRLRCVQLKQCGGKTRHRACTGDETELGCARRSVYFECKVDACAQSLGKLRHAPTLVHDENWRLIDLKHQESDSVLPVI